MERHLQTLLAASPAGGEQGPQTQILVKSMGDDSGARQGAPCPPPCAQLLPAKQGGNHGTFRESDPTTEQPELPGTGDTLGCLAAAQPPHARAASRAESPGAGLRGPKSPQPQPGRRQLTEGMHRLGKWSNGFYCAHTQTVTSASRTSEASPGASTRQRPRGGSGAPALRLQCAISDLTLNPFSRRLCVGKMSPRR